MNGEESVKRQAFSWNESRGNEFHAKR